MTNYSKGKYNNYAYDKNKKLRDDAFERNYRLDNKPVEMSDDTKVRHAILKNIELRISKGEELDNIVEDIASVKEVQEHFSYFEKNGITKPLSEFFKDWYLHKVKNKSIVDKINNLDDRSRD